MKKTLLTTSLAAAVLISAAIFTYTYTPGPSDAVAQSGYSGGADLAPDVAAMLDRALVDCPIKSKIINQCIRESLTSHGYARKTDSFSPAKK